MRWESEEEVAGEFNLLDEKWIRVLCLNYSIKEVSLKEALIQAHTFRDLAGELKAQDIVVLRLMLAVLHMVFLRVTEDEEPEPIEDNEDAFTRWEKIWNEKRFPENLIQEYLEKYRERFYLFHPDYPFYQIPEASIGTKYTASKLNGELSESNNKLRLFPTRTGKLRNQLTYSEAARWLLYVNGYDDTASKAKGKNLPSPGAGWLGKLGIVTAAGNNLFETLMLNLTLLQDGTIVWGENVPVWEMKNPHKEERKEIPIPDNPAELLTLQSRRILLKQEEEQVTGFNLLGGDFFSKENAFAEQMTVWREARDNKNSFQPKRHDSSRLMWRDFASLAVQKDDRHIPGVVRWLTVLREKSILPEDTMMNLRITSVQYGDKDFFITDEFGDSISFAAALLTEKGRIWQDLVVEEIERCEKRAVAIGNLAINLVRAAGGDEKEEKEKKKQAQENFFYQLDIPFRNWLLSLNPQQGKKEQMEKQMEWTEYAGRIARSFGREMVEKSGPNAFVGRDALQSEAKKNVKVQHYCAPLALNWFYIQMKRIEKEG